MTEIEWLQKGCDTRIRVWVDLRSGALFSAQRLESWGLRVQAPYRVHFFPD